MLWPWRITTRPSASVIQRPLWDSGSRGAATAVAVCTSRAVSRSTSTREAIERDCTVAALPRLPNLKIDLSPLRASRDLRLLVAGNLVSGLGTQAALVALPFQVYTQTHSAFLTGLLGLVELLPLVTMALL